MKATYHWMWILVAILMVPIAYGQDETILGALLYERQHRRVQLAYLSLEIHQITLEM